MKYAKMVAIVSCARKYQKLRHNTLNNERLTLANT